MPKSMKLIQRHIISEKKKVSKNIWKKNVFKFLLKESIDLESLTATSKLFHSLGAQTKTARSAVQCCALELVAC